MKKFIFTIMTTLLVMLGVSACNSGATAAEPFDVTVDGAVTCENRDSVLEGMEQVASLPKIQQEERRKDWGESLGSEEAFNKRLGEIKQMECTKGTTSSSSSKATSTTTTNTDPVSMGDGMAEVKSREGETRTLQVVGTDPQRENRSPQVDSRNDPKTPAVNPAALDYGSIRNWRHLYDTVNEHDMQWYINSVNEHSGETGFNWNDVEKWAKDDTLRNLDTRAVNVFGRSEAELPPDQARREAEQVTGKLPYEIPVIYHPNSPCYINTRGLEKHEMHEFLDCKNTVMVSIMRIVWDNGEPKLATSSGVKVDCWNVWYNRYKVATITEYRRGWTVPSSEPINKRVHSSTTPNPHPSTTTERTATKTTPSAPKTETTLTTKKKTTPPPPPPATPTTPSVTTTPIIPSSKNPDDAPGQANGAGDGGASMYGGVGTERFEVTESASAPAAGDPATTVSVAPNTEPETSVTVAPDVKPYGEDTASASEQQPSVDKNPGSSQETDWAEPTAFNPAPIPEGGVNPNPTTHDSSGEAAGNSAGGNNTTGDTNGVDSNEPARNDDVDGTPPD